MSSGKKNGNGRKNGNRRNGKNGINRNERQRNPWDPKLQVLTPERKKELLEKIAENQTIVHHALNPAGYKSLANSLRKSKFYGEKNLNEFLERKLEIIPIRYHGQYIMPSHPTDAAIMRAIEARLFQHMEPRDKKQIPRGKEHWEKDESLRLIYGIAQRRRFLGYKTWAGLVEHIIHAQRMREKERKAKIYAQVEQWLREAK